MAISMTSNRFTYPVVERINIKFLLCSNHFGQLHRERRVFGEEQRELHVREHGRLQRTQLPISGGLICKNSS